MITENKNFENVPALLPQSSVEVPISSMERYREIVSNRQKLRHRLHKLNKQEIVRRLREEKYRIEKRLSELDKPVGNQGSTPNGHLKRKSSSGTTIKIIKKTCPICKQEFLGSLTQKYCGPSCRQTVIYKKPKLIGLRFKVLARDKFTCHYCGRTPQDGAKLQVDHIHPRSQGGKDVLDNLITSCLECNLGKSDVLLSQRILIKDTEETYAGI
jgi:5-methylcytosine-specific restriction endonuclease McrA